MNTIVFSDFAAAVKRRFDFLSAEGEAFCTNISKEDMTAIYLDAFPAGTNPIFRTRTEHDCSCCFSFIRNVGNFVTFGEGGELQTIWQDLGLPVGSTYDVVAKAMDEAVRAANVDRVFRTREARYGTESNYEHLEDGSVLTWTHFWCVVPGRFVVDDIGQTVGEMNVSRELLKRGLTELSLDALEVVADLIEEGNLYRGDQFKGAVDGFLGLKRQFDELSAEQQEVFCWANLGSPHARFKNRAIGTLVDDLSQGMDLTKAVNRYGVKVDPTNYQRSSAVITKGMVEKAVAQVRELGLEDALHRRFATIEDVSVNDVLFADRSVRPHMKDELTDLLMTAVPSTKRDVARGSSTMSVAEFFEDVLPGAESIEMALENEHAGNFVSLTAPKHGDTGRLFSWGNDFAWAYDGNITDSDMRKAVQAAGGRVDGVFRFTHSWNHDAQTGDRDRRNASLMDLHVFIPGHTARPGNGRHDFYGNGTRVGWNNRNHIQTRGKQDVDYTHPAPPGYVPVENITFPSLDLMPEGTYVCKIHNWAKRSPNRGGFKAEIEFGGQLFEYDYPEPLDNKEWVTVAEVTLKAGVFSIKHHLQPKASQFEKWGVKSGEFVPVDTVLLSPNHWGEEGQRSGNLHRIFVLRGCKNPNPVRGFFNEYLRSDLREHRKVFEVLGGKLMCPVSDAQLSGVGFSSTRRATATFRVRKDDTTRTFTVQF